MSSKNLTPLGQFVRPRRMELNMPLREMARRMGKSSAALSLYEVRDPCFPHEWIPKLAEVLDLNELEVAELRAIHDSEMARKHLVEPNSEADPFLEKYLLSRGMLTANDMLALADLLQTLIGQAPKEKCHGGNS